MHFVPPANVVYLFMDNADRHGKKHVKDDYVSILKDEYNVEVVWQVPHSPETNLLDLGVWMSI